MISRMCGRYKLTVEFDRLARIFLAEASNEAFSPRFNIAPSQDAPVVRLDKDGDRTIGLVNWGFVPSWVKGEPKTKPINARAETVATGGMFRQALQRRRCLVPADGFYEWQGAKPPKQPYLIRMKDDGVFAFAGLWERWRPDPDSEPVDTYTIITTTPNAVAERVHNRMPVILKPEDYARWLDKDVSGEGVADLLGPYPAEGMIATAVSTRVNSVKNDDAGCIEPATSISASRSIHGTHE